MCETGKICALTANKNFLLAATFILDSDICIRNKNYIKQAVTKQFVYNMTV
jgi:hypothetical protein